MARRLVLGCGSIGRAVVSELSGRSGDLWVVDRDPDRVETLRNEGIPAERGEPTDADDVDVGRRIDTVFVGGDDPESNLAAARTARDVYPAAELVVYTGTSLSRARIDELEGVADRIVDPGSAVVDHVAETVEGDVGRRHHDLLAELRTVSGRLGVFTHDNPDPDAIASAVALSELSRTVGTEACACYFGEISHQANRAFVNVLALSLTDVDAETFSVEDFDAYALVDHSRPGVNDQLPEELAVDIVIDHHPPRGAVGGRFVDLREDVGATSTLLVDYFRALGAPIDSTVATALLYGIRVDTRDFGREITEADFDAAAHLIQYADVDALARIESPSVSGETLSVLARSISNRKIRGPFLATSVGWTVDRDALAQAADTLLGMEGITTVLVLGLIEGTDTVVASSRTAGSGIDIGEALRVAYDPIGSAGGHTDMAGAQIPLGILAEIEDEEGSIEEVIGDVLIRRFFEVVDQEGSFLSRGESGSSSHAASEPGAAMEQNDFSPRDPST